MYSGSSNTITRRNHRLMHSHTIHTTTTMSRQQGWMYVDHFKPIKDITTYDRQISREYHPINIIVSENLQLIFLIRYNHTGQSILLSPHQCFRTDTITHYEYGIGIQCPPFTRIYDSFRITPVPRAHKGKSRTLFLVFPHNIPYHPIYVSIVLRCITFLSYSP